MTAQQEPITPTFAERLAHQGRVRDVIRWGTVKPTPPEQMTPGQVVLILAEGGGMAIYRGHDAQGVNVEVNGLIRRYSHVALVNPKVAIGAKIVSLSGSGINPATVDRIAAAHTIGYRQEGVSSGGLTSIWVEGQNNPVPLIGTEPEPEVVKAEAASTLTTEQMQAELVTAERRMTEALARAEKSEAALANLWSALHEQAEDRGWCSEFDDFAEEHGGPARTREWDITVTMTTAFGETTLDDALASYLNSEGSAVDVRSSVDIEHRATIRMTLGYNRREIEDGAAHDEIKDHLRQAGWNFDDVDVYEVDVA